MPSVPKVLWVDAFAVESGDGSSEHPLKTAPQHPEAGTELHLRSGLYEGPFGFSGVKLIGHGEVVLTAGAGQTTVSATESSLEQLSVQGGDTGLVAGPGVRLAQVRFSGQRVRAVMVNGALEGHGVSLLANIEGITGVEVTPGASVKLEGAKVEGGFRRGLECQQGEVHVDGFEATGVKAPLHLVECRSTLAHVSARGGTGAAVFAVRGTLTLAGLTVRGHEYGLQLGAGTTASVSQLEVEQTAQACVSVQGSTFSMKQARLKSCGLASGVWLQSADSTIEDLTVGPTPEVGVLVRQGKLTLTRGTFTRISANSEVMGDAVHVRDAKVKLDQVLASDVTGSGLFVSALAEVELGRVEVERARQPAVFVERGSSVKGGALLVRGGGGALVVPDHATVELESLSVAGATEMPVYAECAQGASVKLGRLESAVPQLKSRCVSTGP